jgi:hypothetical protein
MLLGVPKEVKVHEYRVGMTPASVREVINHSHEVVMETGAGIGIGASDDDYKAVGATIADTAEDDCSGRGRSCLPIFILPLTRIRPRISWTAALSALPMKR